jgi:hypothetical protein
MLFAVIVFFLFATKRSRFCMPFVLYFTASCVPNKGGSARRRGAEAIRKQLVVIIVVVIVVVVIIVDDVVVVDKREP